MRKKRMIRFLALAAFFAVSLLPFMCARGNAAADAESAAGRLLVLCYHSIAPKVQASDRYAVSQSRFIEQLEYLRGNGYQPVSLDEIQAALDGIKPLPDKAVLLSFDDGYRSYFDFVFPVLSRMGIPSLLSVVGSWIEAAPPADLPEPLMTWKQIREVSQNPLVAVASHTYDLHKAVPYTPQGNVGPAVSVRAYLPDQRRYESQSAHKARLKLDFDRQNKLFSNRIGRPPRAVVWPYGCYTEISMAAARESGLHIGFALDLKNLGRSSLENPLSINRMLADNSDMAGFIGRLREPAHRQDRLRAVQVDLDAIYCPPPDCPQNRPSAEQAERDLGLLIERLLDLGVNTVFLKAFCDPAATGRVERVYFHNRVLPVQADVFGHAAHQIDIRGIKVYAWMPTQGFIFKGSAAPLDRNRLLFEDLAAGTRISGIFFENATPDITREINGPPQPGHAADQVGMDTDAKAAPNCSQPLPGRVDLTCSQVLGHERVLRKGVQKFRPDAFFARHIRFCGQPCPGEDARYACLLQAYDYVVADFDPQIMQQNGRSLLSPLSSTLSSSIRKLAGQAAAEKTGRQKTILRLHARDDRNRRWIAEEVLLGQMRTALSAGIRHLALWPDDFRSGRPAAGVIGLEISTRSEPLLK